MRHTKTWTISLPPAMEREAERLADSEQRTKSELVREALRLYMVSRKLETIQQVATVRARARGIRTDADVERVVNELRA